jgi:hypothetical protein
MYSYEERIIAVELYIKLGKRLRATIRQLGCSLPSCGPIFRVGRKSPDGEFHIAAGNAGLPS